MDFFRLTTSQDPRYDQAMTLYETSFPLHEQRSREMQQALMGNPAYHFHLILEGERFAGILLSWSLGDYAYIEHFAISPALRGQSVGSHCLDKFCGLEKNVVLEIDPPVDDISRRRQRFYEKLGFVVNSHEHIHPGYRKDAPPHTLVVMSRPTVLSKGQYQIFREDLEEVVMRDIYK